MKTASAGSRRKKGGSRGNARGPSRRVSRRTVRARRITRKPRRKKSSATVANRSARRIIVNYTRLVIILQLFFILIIVLHVTSRDGTPAGAVVLEEQLVVVPDEWIVESVRDAVHSSFYSNKDLWQGIKQVSVSKDDLDFLVKDQNGVSCEGHVLGAFHDDTILIRHVNQETNDYTIHHEVGHNVWNKLSPEQRDAWRALYKQTTNFITEYSKVNANENFAENFACFMTDFKECSKNMMQEKTDFVAVIVG